MTADTLSGHAVVLGASGGLGQALVEALTASGRYGKVTGLSRRHDGLDVTSEASIAAMAETMRTPVSLLINTIGILHEARGDGAGHVMPEKALRDLDPDRLMRLFAVNAIGPALVVKHFAPKMVRQGRCVMATLSARVGSIGDNQLGGWYGYRASKAALNQLIATSAIELRLKRPDLICVGLHPGTVQTPMSAPFLANYRANEIFTPAQSAHHLLSVIDGLTTGDSGKVLAWDGQVIPP